MDCLMEVILGFSQVPFVRGLMVEKKEADIKVRGQSTCEGFRFLINLFPR